METCPESLTIEFESIDEMTDLVNFLLIAKRELESNPTYNRRYTDNEKQSCNDMHESLKTALNDYFMAQKARDNDLSL